MKNKKILTKVMVVLAACFMFASFSPSLDGRAVVVESGVFPQGLFAKTVGYLPGDIISVANITGETTVDLLVIGALDPSEGVAIMLSPEAADAIGIDKDANNIVKITKRSGQDERVYGTAIIAKQNPGEVEQDVAPVIKEEEESFDAAPAKEAFVEELPEEEEEEFIAEEEIPEETAEDESEDEFEEEFEADEEEFEADVEEESEENLEEENVIPEEKESEDAETEETEETPDSEFIEEAEEEAVAEEDLEEAEEEEAETEEDLEEEYEEEPLVDLPEETEETTDEETEEAVEAEEETEAEAEELDTEIEEEIGLPFDEEAEEEYIVPLPLSPVEESVEEEVPELPYEEETEDDDTIDAIIEAELEDYEAENYDESEETEEYEAIVLVPVDAVPPVTEIEETDENEVSVEETTSVEEAPAVEIDEVEDVESVEDDVDENAPIIIEPVASTEPAPVVVEPVKETAKESVGKSEMSYEKYMVGGLGDLQSGKYYIQLAALTSDENIMEIVNKYSKNYPITIVPMAGGVRKQVMVGPLSMDEYAVVLERFKSYGYKDAFLRKIK